jgi:hypothetical protein
MGIRIALGALRSDVLRLIVGDCARFALAGTLSAAGPPRSLAPGLTPRP